MRNTHIPRLRQERERRGWSRNYVAEHIQVDVVTVGRWERGERLPHPVYRQKLCDLFAMNAENLGLFLEPCQECDEEAIDLDFSSTKDGFIRGGEPQADMDASDALDTMNEGAGSSQPMLASQEETTKGKTSRNTWFSSHLAHLPRRDTHLVLVIALLAVVTVFGVFSFAPSTHTVTSFHLIYTNGTILPEDCTYRNKGPIIAPHEVANGCSVRAWLYQNDHKTGRALCLSPGTTTGILHTRWVYFWVSKNTSVCS